MKKNRDISTPVLMIVLLIGLSLLLYPSFSDWWNARVSSRAIVNYSEAVAHLNQKDYSDLWEAAKAYNQKLLDKGNVFLRSEEEIAEYDQLLNVSGNGVMAYIDIPVIDVELPIYHGTENSVLAIAIGHLDWTSLPTGGESTHCVVSGHRGLPSARLFTDLDQLVVGDLFMLNVLDEVLTYEVDQILIVEPNDTDALLIQEGKDLVTLVTCTPYGINSHRLLVRGHRVENLEQTQIVRVTADAVIIEKLVVAPFVLIPILLLMLIILLIPKRKH